MSTTTTPTSSGGKRIVFTGGSGKAGRHVIPYLLSRGHQVLNLDLIPFPDPNANVYTLKTDLTDSGQVFNALTTHFGMEGYERERSDGGVNGEGMKAGGRGLGRGEGVDVVVHFAAYARNMLVPDSELFQANTCSTYNVIEAACKLGVKKIVIASSETVYGVCFAQGDRDYDYFPLEEDYDCDPEDTYALSKICGEKTARAFARRFGVDIYCLRIGNVIEPHEYVSLFPSFLSNPLSRKRNAWSYIDARDLGQIVHLCTQKNGLGWCVFNATNDGITVTEGEGSTRSFLERMGGVNGKEGKVVFKREMGRWEAPLNNRKVKEVLGFREEHDWKRYVKSE